MAINIFKKNKKLKIEMIILFIVLFPFLMLSIKYDLFEKFYFFSRSHESFELDEILTTYIFLSFIMIIYYFRRTKDLVRANNIISQKNNDLEKAIKEINQLKGLITICSVCKRIKIDKNYWQRIEEYISDNSDVKFTHGICMDCANKIYPDIIDKSKK